MFEAPSLVFAAAGIAVFVAAVLPKLLRNAPLSMPMVFLGAGMLAFTLLPDLPDPDPVARRVRDAPDRSLRHHLADGRGVGAGPPVPPARWSTTWRMLGIAMPLCILAMTLLGLWVLGLGLARPFWLGRRWRPPTRCWPPRCRWGARRREDETDAGGRGPLRPDLRGRPERRTRLPLCLPGHRHQPGWRVPGGVVPALVRRGCALADRRRRAAGLRQRARPWAGSSSPPGTKLPAVRPLRGLRGAGRDLPGLRRDRNGGGLRLHRRLRLRGDHPGRRAHPRLPQVLHSYVEQLERLHDRGHPGAPGRRHRPGPAGGDRLDRGAGGARVPAAGPAAGRLAGPGPGKPGPRERLAISFFGIRGIGSLYYLAYALSKGDFDAEAQQFWAFVGLVVAMSIVVHGATTAPLMNRLDRLRERKKAERKHGDQGQSAENADLMRQEPYHSVRHGRQPRPRHAGRDVDRPPAAGYSELTSDVW